MRRIRVHFADNPIYSGMAKDNSRKLEVECARCGTFRISDQALDAPPPREKHLLSYVCRTWSSDGVPEILTTNIQTLTKRAPVRTFPEKRDWMLELMAQKTSEAGDDSEFDIATDYPLVTASSVREAEWLKKSLEDAGLVEASSLSSTLDAVTMEGWEYLSQLRQSGPNSAFVFVAMSFAAEMSEFYDKAIEPAVRQAGYEPIRVDRREHANSIDDEIIGNIRKARFMGADFTGQRAGVYFEAGMMNGLGRTVVWMCDKRELERRVALRR